MNLLCAMADRRASRLTIAESGMPGRPDRVEVPQPGIAGVEHRLGAAVGLPLVARVLVDLEVDDELHVHALVDGLLELVEHRSVGELVEASADRIAGPGGSDEPQHRVVEVAAEPGEGLLALPLGRLPVGSEVAEPQGIPLAGGDAAIEEHVVRAAVERLGLDVDLDDGPRAIEVLRRPRQRMEHVGVRTPRPAREVVPDEALDRMLERGDDRRCGRRGHHAGEHLEPAHEEALVPGRVDPLDGEAEQARPGCRVRVDAEGDRVRARDREDADPAGHR